jgi:hypothetical protein
MLATLLAKGGSLWSAATWRSFSFATGNTAAPQWFSDEHQSGVKPPHSTRRVRLNSCRSHANAIRYKNTKVGHGI